MISNVGLNSIAYVLSTSAVVLFISFTVYSYFLIPPTVLNGATAVISSSIFESDSVIILESLFNNILSPTAYFTISDTIILSLAVSTVIRLALAV